MKKEEIIKNIDNVNIIKGSNSMGVSENFYNPYFLMSEMFKENKVDKNNLTEKELNLIYDTANFASDVFY